MKRARDGACDLGPGHRLDWEKIGLQAHSLEGARF